MAYTPDLEESNDVQRQRYASAPVVANAAANRSVDYSQEFGTGSKPAPVAEADPMAAFYSSGVGVDFGGDTVPAGSRTERVAPAADPITGPTPAPVGPPRNLAGPVDESAKAPRVYDAGNGVVVPRPAQTAPQGYPATDANLIRDSLSSRQRAQERTLSAASDEANVRETTTGMRADAARAQASYDLAGAEQAARVARFRAANGADVILGSSRRSKDRAAGILGAQADAAERKVAVLSGRANTADPAGRDVLADAINLTDASNKGLAATTAGQSGVVNSALEQQKLEQAQRVNQMGAAVTNAKTPQERAEATKSLLALLGKDPKKNYTAHPVVFPDSVDPATGAVLRGGSAIAVVSDDGSPPQIIKLDGSGGAGANAPKSLDQFMQAARADPRNKGKSDEELKAFYTKTYGAK